MQVRDIRIEDYHDFVNSLLDGPSKSGVASLRIDWLASQDRHHFRDPGNGFDAEVAFNTAQVAWAGHTDTARYVSDPASTSTTLFAEFGHERNGVFF